LRGIRLAGTSVLVTALTWTLCSLLVAAAPGRMMGMTGGMLHADFSGAACHLTLATFVVGLISWSILAGIAAALLAWTYNRLSAPAPTA
jgi:hypothetical protein